MTIDNKTKKIDVLKTAIESIDTLISEHGEKILKPVYHGLKRKLNQEKNLLSQLKTQQHG